MDFVLNKLNTLSLVSVIVTVIVSAFPESSDTNIDFMIAVVAVGTVYSVVADVVVRSTFLFINELAKENYDQQLQQSFVRDVDSIVQKLNTTYQQDLKDEAEAEAFFFG